MPTKQYSACIPNLKKYLIWKPNGKKKSQYYKVKVTVTLKNQSLQTNKVRNKDEIIQGKQQKAVG